MASNDDQPLDDPEAAALLVSRLQRSPMESVDLATATNGLTSPSSDYDHHAGEHITSQYNFDDRANTSILCPGYISMAQLIEYLSFRIAITFFEKEGVCGYLAQCRSLGIPRMFYSL